MLNYNCVRHVHHELMTVGKGDGQCLFGSKCLKRGEQPVAVLLTLNGKERGVGENNAFSLRCVLVDLKLGKNLRKQHGAHARNTVGLVAVVEIDGEVELGKAIGGKFNRAVL